ncbi:hypothetical protein SAMCCGM7_pC0827 (plasmid) [Sinorhizobium americanum CCGM7]|nr:hypothetical protein SAMCCGM7_pC0827 [Sinorhizobium americanum CCGM7]
MAVIPKQIYSPQVAAAADYRCAAVADGCSAPALCLQIIRLVRTAGVISPVANPQRCGHRRSEASVLILRSDRSNSSVQEGAQFLGGPNEAIGTLECVWRPASLPPSMKLFRKLEFVNDRL